MVDRIARWLRDEEANPGRAGSLLRGRSLGELHTDRPVINTAESPAATCAQRLTKRGTGIHGRQLHRLRAAIEHVEHRTACCVVQQRLFVALNDCSATRWLGTSASRWVGMTG
ncbi:MAG TPA: hypothetical protein VG815_20155, partial [Chloroflexota bacterium]|nr:hypothetical protein [Chloroflexota bacterium]